MAELVDAHDSKSCSFGSEGSTPSLGTMNHSKNINVFFRFMAPPPSIEIEWFMGEPDEGVVYSFF